MGDRLEFKIKPDKRGNYYQLRNIHIKQIQDIINNSDPNSYNAKCDKSIGWILKKDEAKIREIMNKQLLIWIDKEKENIKATDTTSIDYNDYNNIDYITTKRRRQ